MFKLLELDPIYFECLLSVNIGERWGRQTDRQTDTHREREGGVGEGERERERE